jgi:hypothetical protein
MAGNGALNLEGGEGEKKLVSKFGLNCSLLYHMITAVYHYSQVR